MKAAGVNGAMSNEGSSQGMLKQSFNTGVINKYGGPNGITGVESSAGMNQTVGGGRFRGNGIQIIVENDEEHREQGVTQNSSRSRRNSRVNDSNSKQT